MSSSISTSDRIFDAVYHTNITEAIRKFQECIVHYNNTGFDGGNQDLGGIAVRIGLLTALLYRKALLSYLRSLYL
jgi:hypothetical protein